MQSFLTLIGILGCILAVTISLIKAIEVVFFFKGFRDEVNHSLAKIQETLRNQKP